MAVLLESVRPEEVRFGAVETFMSLGL